MILLHSVETKRFANASTALARVGGFAKVTLYADDDGQFDVLNHVFASQFQYIATNPNERARHCQRFAKVMEKWQDLCATLPSEWQFVDEEQTIPVALTCESIKQQLETYKLDNFWNTK